MCGRFRLGKGREALKKFFGAYNDIEWEPRYNLAPTQDIPVVLQDPHEPKRLLSLMRWGLIPNWSKDTSTAARMINARSESVADLPAFREPLRSHRCLIPADGFYEWKKSGKAREPYCFSLPDNDIFAFAGLWDRWRSPEGRVVETCSILTTSANDLVRDIHDRMPVILSPDAYDLWLDPGFVKRDGILELLQPCPAASMKKFAVSSRVNDVSNDDAECALPVEPAREEQPTLFPRSS